MGEIESYLKLLPGFNAYLAAIAFVLTYGAKMFWKDYFASKEGSRLVPVLPLVFGVVASMLFWVGSPETAASQPASLPSSLPVLAVVVKVSWVDRLGAGILNGFYSMGFFQVFSRVISGKEGAPPRQLQKAMKAQKAMDSGKDVPAVVVSTPESNSDAPKG